MDHVSLEFTMFFNPKPPRRVLFYTRRHCHLCDEALDLLYRESKRHAMCIDIVDIDHSPMLQAEFDQAVPVIFVDGVKRFFGRVDPMLLRRVFESPGAVAE